MDASFNASSANQSLLPSAAHILVADDDPDACELLAVLLKQVGCRVTTVTTAAAALRLARVNSFNLMVLDHWFADGSGVDLCKQIRAFDPCTPILFYSGAAFASDIEDGISAGAQAYLTKPCEPDVFQKVVSKLSSVKCARDLEPSQTTEDLLRRARQNATQTSLDARRAFAASDIETNERAASAPPDMRHLAAGK